MTETLTAEEYRELLTRKRRRRQSLGVFAGVSELEASFDYYWLVLEGPALVQEHWFDEVRHWRFDRAHLASRVAIEIDGGTWSRGRHVQPDGFAKDCAKINAATAAGWVVFRLTGDMLHGDPEGHLRPILDTIQRRLADA